VKKDWDGFTGIKRAKNARAAIGGYGQKGACAGNEVGTASQPCEH